MTEKEAKIKLKENNNKLVDPSLTAFVSLQNVNKVYPNGVHAVYDFNLDINKHDFIALVGPSGCGKSTTLRMIAGLEEISSGSLYINKVYSNYLQSKDRNIAMVFQSYALYPQKTVYENIAFGLKIRHLPKEEIEERVFKASEILDLGDYLDRRPKELSGGQMQRVALGRAIVRQADLFLMDEPLSNLDAKLRVQMRIEISKLHDRLGATIIYVTHDQTEAMTLGTRIVVMSAGVVQQVDTPENLYNNPANLFVATFIGSPQMNIVDAKIEANGGKLYAVVGDAKLEIPASKAEAMKAYAGKEVKMGIRPEDIYDTNFAEKLDKANSITSSIRVYELLGAEVFLYFDYAGVQFTARVNPSTKIRQGDSASFTFDMEKTHFFDKDTEEAICN